MAKQIVKQPNKKAKILKSEIIYEGKAFGVRRDELIEPTGVRTIREIVTHPGSVVVLPVLPDGRVVSIATRHGSTCGSWSQGEWSAAKIRRRARNAN
jgi:hypothetical protein